MERHKRYNLRLNYSCLSSLRKRSDAALHRAWGYVFQALQGRLSRRFGRMAFQQQTRTIHSMPYFEQDALTRKSMTRFSTQYPQPNCGVQGVVQREARCGILQERQEAEYCTRGAPIHLIAVEFSRASRTVAAFEVASAPEHWEEL